MNVGQMDDILDEKGFWLQIQSWELFIFASDLVQNDCGVG